MESGVWPRLAEGLSCAGGRCRAKQIWALRALLCLLAALGPGVDLGERLTNCKVTYRSHSSALLILRENCTSKLIRACLSPNTVHFPIGEIIGTAGEAVGCLTGGAEGRHQHLGERVAVQAGRHHEMKPGARWPCQAKKEWSWGLKIVAEDPERSWTRRQMGRVEFET